MSIAAEFYEIREDVRVEDCDGSRLAQEDWADHGRAVSASLLRA